MLRRPNGQQVYEMLQKLTQEEREALVGFTWLSADDVDELIDEFTVVAVGNAAGVEKVRALSDEDRKKMFEAARAEVEADEGVDEDDRPEAIRDLIWQGLCELADAAFMAPYENND